LLFCRSVKEKTITGRVNASRLSVETGFKVALTVCTTRFLCHGLENEFLLSQGVSYAQLRAHNICFYQEAVGRCSCCQDWHWDIRMLHPSLCPGVLLSARESKPLLRPPDRESRFDSC